MNEEQVEVVSKEDLSGEDLHARDFWRWFDRTRSEIPIRSVERFVKIPRGRIGNAYAVKRPPTYDICTAIADGLDLNLKLVLAKARLLELPDSLTEEEENLLVSFRDLSQADRNFVLDIVEALRRFRNAPVKRSMVKKEIAAMNIKGGLL